MKVNIFVKLSIFVTIILNVSCNQEINEPELNNHNISSIIGSFEFQSITQESHEIMVRWTSAANAIRYDVLVNDTVGLFDIKNNVCLLNNLEPDTEYKISIRAYDKNNFTKSINKYVKTLTFSYNEITALPFGRYEYQRFNITNCKKTSDNNYIILGDAFIYNKTYKIVLKTDKNFNIIWKYNFEGGLFDYMNVVERQNINECDDGGFLIISKEFIFKLSKNGNLEFQKKYNIENFEPWIQNGIQTTNGNLLFVGSHFWMVNQNFDAIWTLNSNYIEITDVIQNNTGNFFLYGYKKINNSNEYYTTSMLEIDNFGNQLNEITYPISNSCYSSYLLKSKDNGYYLISNSNLYIGSTEFCATKVDIKGKEIWTIHSYPEIKMSNSIRSAIVLQDNSLICLCYIDSLQSYYIFEISPEGKLIKTFIAGDMYVPIFVDKDENGKYKILTQGGYIYFLTVESSL